MKRSLVVLFVLALSLSGFAHAQCAAFPCVVASVSLVDQTEPVRTAVFTPTNSGLFRVTVYMEASHTPSSHWDLFFYWKDDLRPTGMGLGSPMGGQILTNSFNVRAIAGGPISYILKKGKNTPPEATYNLFITVEQLQ